MSPRFDEEKILEYGWEDLSDFYGVTPPAGYSKEELFPYFPDYDKEWREYVDKKKRFRKTSSIQNKN